MPAAIAGHICGLAEWESGVIKNSCRSVRVVAGGLERLGALMNRRATAARDTGRGGGPFYPPEGLPVADVSAQTREFTVIGALVSAFAIAAIFAGAERD